MKKLIVVIFLLNLTVSINAQDTLSKKIVANISDTFPPPLMPWRDTSVQVFPPKAPVNVPPINEPKNPPPPNNPGTLTPPPQGNGVPKGGTGNANPNGYK